MEDDCIPIEEADIEKIAQTLLQNSWSPNETISFLVNLAIDLCTDLQFVREVKSDLEEDYWNEISIEKHEALYEILKNWWSRKAEENKKPSFEEFISAVCANSSTININAEALLRQFALTLTNRSKVNCGSDQTETEDEEENSMARDSLPICSTAQERALSNPLILDEIFKQLNFKTRENFRLVNSSWRKESLRFWRKSSRIQIINNDCSGIHYKYQINLPVGIKLKEFVALPTLLAVDEELTRQFRLLELPYRSFRLYLNVFQDFHYSCGAGNKDYEDWFWISCGPYLEDLRVSEVKLKEIQLHRTFFLIFKRLVLEVAPNLKKLHIDKSCGKYNSRFLEHESVEEIPVPLQKFTEKLETLALHIFISTEDTRKILKLCPNLKGLSVLSSKTIEGLLERSANGEYIKIEKLEICPSLKNFSIDDDFLLLRNYSQLLPDTLRNLRLKSININDNVSLQNIYAALANCRNLQSLELHLFGERRTAEGTEFQKRFIDLPAFSFANLQKLKLKIQIMKVRNEADTTATVPVLFNFGMLMLMSKLVEMEVSIVDFRNKQIDFSRRPEIKDWIYEGPGNAPTGGGEEKMAILCESLKKFSFFGWDITVQDIHLISKWFPRLNSLSATFSLEEETLSVAVESLKKLERLEISTKNFIYLNKLRPLKEMNKYLKIIVHINLKILRGSYTVEVKEDGNGDLYYDRYGDKTFWFEEAKAGEFPTFSTHYYYDENSACSDSDEDEFL